MVRNVTLADASVAAAAGDLAGGKLVLLDHTTRGGRQLACRLFLPGRGRSCSRGCGGCRFLCFRGFAGLGLRGRLRRSAGRLLFNDRKQLPARYRRARRLVERLDDSRCGCRHFEHDLVGLEVCEVFVARDRLADLLVPGDERRVRDGFGQLRNADFQCHDGFPVSADATSASCSRWWMACMPVAGAAALSRPA